MVSVNLILRDNLILKAQSAKEEYESSAQKEAIALNEFETEVNKHIPTGSGGNNSGGDSNAGEKENPSENEDNKLPDVSKLEEGDTVQWDSNKDRTTETWIVFNKKEKYAEIISASVMGSLTLGSGDSLSQVSVPDVDEDGDVDDGDRAVASYNNAIDTINNYCKELITAIESDKVRSVGASTECTSEYYTISVMDSWKNGIFNGKALDSDWAYGSDYSQISKLNIFDTVGENNYWIASRDNVTNSSNSVGGILTYDFKIRYFNNKKSIQNSIKLFSFSKDGTIIPDSQSLPVRPVVRIEF